MPVRKTLACVTMAYNEADMLPLWLRHYGGQVGSAACYVIDHGSDDGSTEALGTAKRLRLARSALDETARAAFVGQVCAQLLNQYDYVAYTDADELLVPDPARWGGLLDFVNDSPPTVTTAFGMNLLHRMGHEYRWDPECPILAQRHWAFPVSSMFKPSLVGRPVTWSPGFHSADAPIELRGLFLFHLAYFDYQTAIRRQAKRRGQIFRDMATAPHHRVSDDEVRAWMEGWSRMPCNEDVQFDASCKHMAKFCEKVLDSRIGRERAAYPINLSLMHDRLWRVPERFVGAF